MSILGNVLDVVYILIGLLFVSGAGALMLMFAFVQVTARVAIWLDVGRAFIERKQLAAEVLQLKATIDLLMSGEDDPTKPLVTAIVVSEPKKLGGPDGDSA